MLAWLKLRERTQRPANALAQLVELQSRIRPHFLFNTLNSAIALVQIDPARAESVLEDLAELFRVALADASASVSLEEEIDLARRYLAIEQIRFGKRLRITWRLDPAAKRARVPPLLLQPLVENAVRHGVEPNEEGGELEIITNQKGSEVEIRITNTVGQPTQATRPRPGPAQCASAASAARCGGRVRRGRQARPLQPAHRDALAMNPLKILIVDDEPLARLRLRGLVEAIHDQRGELRLEVVAEAATGTQAGAYCASTPATWCCSTTQMPGP